MLHFSWATDLDPKGANNQIKESIEPVLSRSIASMVNNTTGLGTSNATSTQEESRFEDISDESFPPGVPEEGMDISVVSDSEATL